MPVNVFGQGAVQTAYVSYIAYPNFNANLTLFWPSTYTTSSTILAASNSFTPSTTGLTVTLPDATQVSPGMNALIKNDGSPSFTLKNNAGGNVGTILDGVTYFIQLTDTSTAGGVWTIAELGAGTSSADAAALAGYGLAALNSPLNLNFDMPVKTTAVNLTLSASDRGSLYVLTGGESNVYCPDNGTTTVAAGFNVSFNNAGSGVVTFTGTTNTATFNGQTSLLLNPGQTMTLDYDGTNYWSVGLGQSTSFGINILDQDLAPQITGGHLNLTDLAASKLIQQFYCSAGPITGNITIYYPANANTWYISNFCTSSNGSTISVCLGTNTAPIGTPVLIPNGQRIILYAANLNGIAANDLQMYATPTLVINPSSVLFPNGTAGSPSIAFTNDTVSGVYLKSISNPTIAAHGVDVLQFNGNNGSGVVQLLANPNANTVPEPTYSFQGFPATGMGCNTTTGSLSLYAPGGPTPIGLSLASAFCNIPWVIKLGLLVNGEPDIVGIGSVSATNTGMGIGIESTTNQIQFYSSTGAPPTYAPIASLLDTSSTTTTFRLFEESAPTATGYMKISGTAGTQVLALGTTTDQLRITAGGGVTVLNNLTLNGGFGGNPTTGDICYFNGTNWVDLPIGTTGQFLKVVGGLPAWAT